MYPSLNKPVIPPSRPKELAFARQFAELAPSSVMPDRADISTRRSIRWTDHIEKASLKITRPSAAPDKSAIRSESLLGRMSNLRDKNLHVVLSFEKLADYWGLTNSQRAIIIGYDDHPEIYQMLTSFAVGFIGRDTKDRIAYLLAISVSLGSLLGDDHDAEMRWLSTRQAELGFETPLNHMLKGKFFDILDIYYLVRHLQNID